MKKSDLSLKVLRDPKFKKLIKLAKRKHSIILALSATEEIEDSQ